MAGFLTLAVETATGCGSVALTRGGLADGRVLAEYTLQPEVVHSRRLLGLVEHLMAATGTAWADLEAVAVSRGPGSFTGLRIGMAAAKGIALATGRPLVGVPTLDALAAQAWGADGQLCCVLDARKGQMYAAFYRCDAGGKRHRTGDFLVLSPAALAARITEPTLVLGPGAALCAPWLAACAEARVVVSAALHPRAALVGLCAAEALAAGATDGSADLAPLYVRASEAELGLGAKRSQGEQP